VRLITQFQCLLLGPQRGQLSLQLGGRFGGFLEFVLEFAVRTLARPGVFVHGCLKPGDLAS
jgi:hypothetical protein